jgi:hypothetical protein
LPLASGLQSDNLNDYTLIVVDLDFPLPVNFELVIRESISHPKLMEAKVKFLRLPFQSLELIKK